MIVPTIRDYFACFLSIIKSSINSDSSSHLYIHFELVIDSFYYHTWSVKEAIFNHYYFYYFNWIEIVVVSKIFSILLIKSLLLSLLLYSTLSSLPFVESPPLSSPPVKLEESWSLKKISTKFFCKKLCLWTLCELDLLIFVWFSYLNTMKK